MSSSYSLGGYNQIFIEEDSVPTHEEQPLEMSARVCLHGIFCSIKPLQLLILPSDWMIPSIPVAQLAMPICLALALAFILTKENQKKQKINFTTKKFLLFNLLLSSQELHYSSISSVSHVALMQILCLILCNLGVFAVIHSILPLLLL